MRVQILCDSCCDFTATERLSSVFQKVPATVVVSGCRLADDKQFQQRALLEALRAESLELKLEFPDERAYLEAMAPGAEERYRVTSSAARTPEVFAGAAGLQNSCVQDPQRKRGAAAGGAADLPAAAFRVRVPPDCGAG